MMTDQRPDPTGPVLVFPGQGSLDGPALRHARDDASIREVFDQIDEVTVELFGGRLSERVLAAAPDTHEPWVSQLAIYASSVGAYRALRANDVRPSLLVGHSLGEISALVCAGAFDVTEGARLVGRRTELATEFATPGGAMAAVSCDENRARLMVDLVGDPGLAVAIANGAGQTVVSGPAPAVDRLRRLASALDAETVLLEAPFAFHSPMMGPIVRPFATFAEQFDQQALRHPVHSPILGRRYEPTDVLADALAEHLVQPVRFGAAVEWLVSGGHRLFVEVGGKAALGRLIQRIARAEDVRVLATLAMTPPMLALGGTIRELIGRAVAQVPQVPPIAAPLQPVPERSVADPGTTPVVPADPQPGWSRNRVWELAVAQYAGALEYPADVFANGALLEAELGVDSVRQIELLGRLAEQVGLPVRPADFRIAELDTLDRVVDAVTRELTAA
jgi:acyl transferase domain-containing protein